MFRFVSVLTLGITLFTGTNAWAATITVDPASLDPTAFDTLQSAIDFAGNGDTVEVVPGTYEAGITIEGKVLSLVAIGGPDETILIPKTGPMIQVVSPPSAGTSIEGFSMNEAPEGALLLKGAIVTLKDMVLQNVVGTAVTIDNESQILLENLEITNGFGIGAAPTALQVSGNSTVTLKDSYLGSNTSSEGSTVHVEDGSTLKIQRTFICNNTSGATGTVHVSGANLTIQSSIFATNSATQGGVLGTSSMGEGNAINVENAHFVNNEGLGSVAFLGTGTTASATNIVMIGPSSAAFAFEDGDSSGLVLQFSAYTQGDSIAVGSDGSPLSFTGGEGIQIFEDEDDMELHPGEDCEPGSWEPKADSPLLNTGDPAIKDPFEFPNHQESNIGAYGGPEAMFPAVNSDDDSHPDLFDNCPLVDNENQDDADEDGTGDLCDSTSGLTDDKDKDGIPDADDNCIQTRNADQKDWDKDGLGDLCDANDDDDPTPDLQDCAPKDNTRYPGNSETCNGIDDDCDGLTDNGIFCSEEEGGSEGGQGLDDDKWTAVTPEPDVVDSDVEEAPVATSGEDDGGCQQRPTHSLPIAGVILFMVLSFARRSRGELPTS